MAARIAFVLITVFWITMNCLLWRFEGGERDRAGGVVPVEMVFKKILTAPDTSSLEIFHHGEKVGFCRLASTIIQVSHPDHGETDVVDRPPEGMIRQTKGFSIDFEGNLALGEFMNRLRFDSNLKITPDREWREFSMRLNVRPTVLLVKAIAESQRVEVVWENDGMRTERTIRLQGHPDPQDLMDDIGGPFLSGFMSTLGLAGATGDFPAAAMGLEWVAHYDWMYVGHTSMRVFRLQTRFMDRWDVVVIVSRVGEILRVELPDEVVITNDELINF